MRDKLTRRQVHISDRDWDRLAAIARRKSCPIAVLVRWAVADWLDRQGTRPETGQKKP